MRGMEITECLMHFNLTRQEATLYLLLLKAGRLTGYEAAKQTGISRSNNIAFQHLHGFGRIGGKGRGLYNGRRQSDALHAGNAGGVLQQ